jgi:hypothetical protein
MVKIISFFFFFFLLFCLGGIDFRLRLITMSWRYMMMPDGSPATPACWPGPLNYSDSGARCYLNNTRKQRYTGATHAGRCCCCCVVVSFFFFKFFFPGLEFDGVHCVYSGPASCLFSPPFLSLHSGGRTSFTRLRGRPVCM